MTFDIKKHKQYNDAKAKERFEKYDTLLSKTTPLTDEENEFIEATRNMYESVNLIKFKLKDEILYLSLTVLANDIDSIEFLLSIENYNNIEAFLNINAANADFIGIINSNFDSPKVANRFTEIVKNSSNFELLELLQSYGASEEDIYFLTFDQEKINNLVTNERQVAIDPTFYKIRCYNIAEHIYQDKGFLQFASKVMFPASPPILKEPVSLKDIMYHPFEYTNERIPENNVFIHFCDAKMILAESMHLLEYMRKSVKHSIMLGGGMHELEDKRVIKFFQDTITKFSNDPDILNIMVLISKNGVAPDASNLYPIIQGLPESIVLTKVQYIFNVPNGQSLHEKFDYSQGTAITVSRRTNSTNSNFIYQASEIFNKIARNQTQPVEGLLSFLNDFRNKYESNEIFFKGYFPDGTKIEKTDIQNALTSFQVKPREGNDFLINKGILLTLVNNKIIQLLKQALIKTSYITQIDTTSLIDSQTSMKDIIYRQLHRINFKELNKIYYELVMNDDYVGKERGFQDFITIFYQKTKEKLKELNDINITPIIKLQEYDFILVDLYIISEYKIKILYPNLVNDILEIKDTVIITCNKIIDKFKDNSIETIFSYWSAVPQKLNDNSLKTLDLLIEFLNSNKRIIKPNEIKIDDTIISCYDKMIFMKNIANQDKTNVKPAIKRLIDVALNKFSQYLTNYITISSDNVVFIDGIEIGKLSSRLLPKISNLFGSIKLNNPEQKLKLDALNQNLEKWINIQDISLINKESFLKQLGDKTLFDSFINKLDNIFKDKKISKYYMNPNADGDKAEPSVDVFFERIQNAENRYKVLVRDRKDGNNISSFIVNEAIEPLVYKYITEHNEIMRTKFNIPI